MHKRSRIYIAGHRGLVGSALVRVLEKEGYQNLILRGRGDLDLSRQANVEAFFEETRPEFVFAAAAKVGGILANHTHPAEFIYQNLAIEINLIDAAYRYGVAKLAFFGSSCIYPKLAPQPLREEYLLTAPLEPTNEAYAVAKIAGIRMAQAYWREYGFRTISLMPTNLYGPGDNFDPESSHVLPALVRRFHDAKKSGAAKVELWGSGTPRRELLHVDDLAEAALFLMVNYESEQIVNVGTGIDLTIRELAELVAEVVGFEGSIVPDPSKPDGTPRKLLDTSRLTALGWRPRIDLKTGIRDLYAWYLAGDRMTSAMAADRAAAHQGSAGVARQFS